jgi:hypothetical protein
MDSGDIDETKLGTFGGSSELPKMSLGITGTVLMHDFSVSSDGFSKGHSTALIGLSVDLTFGEKGDVETGFGGRRLGAGVNFNSNGVTGGSIHYGTSFPPSFFYGQTGK